MATPPDKSKAFSLSKANPHDRSSVNDIIKKWQTSGGGVLHEVEVIADCDSEASKSATGGGGSGSGSKSGKSRSSQHSKSKSEGQLIIVGENGEIVEDEARVKGPKTPSQVSRRSEGKEKEKERKEEKEVATELPKPNIVERKPWANALDEDVKAAIAPKKRIISDGHWKRKHIDPNAKPPPPPKKPPVKKDQYGWVRPPLLTRPGQDDAPTSPTKNFSKEPEHMKVYTGKGTTKPIVTQIHTQLSMRPKNSVPMPMPTPAPTPTTPLAPRVRKRSVVRPKSADDSPPKSAPARTAGIKFNHFDGGYTSNEERPGKARTAGSKSSHVEDWLSNSGEIPRKSRTSRSNSHQIESAYTDNEAKPRKRLSKTREPDCEALESETPSRKRSKSLGAPPARIEARRRSIQKSPEEQHQNTGEQRSRRQRTSAQVSDDQYQSASEQRSRRQRTSTKLSDDQRKSSHDNVAPPSPPRELNNYDDEAEKRRTAMRAEFATYTPPKEQRRKKSSKRFSYSPEGIERLPMPSRNEPMREPVPPQRQSSARIDAWLTETPDPFRETKKAESRRAFSFEKPRRNVKSESIADTETVYTETTITDSTLTDLTESTVAPPKPVSNRKPSRDARTSADRKTRAASEPSNYLDSEIEIEHSSTTSVPTLKRSGTKHADASPTTKSRSRAPASVTSYTESYTETEVSSSIVSSSLDPRDFPKPGERNKPYSAARRLFPTTGKQLSTIVSVETLAVREPPLAKTPAHEKQEVPGLPKDTAMVITEPIKEDMLTPLPNLSDGSVVSAARSRTSLKRKLTKHSDLMTVLSLPASRSKSVVSARSIRTHKSRLETATLEDLMAELATDEVKYMRELRTLADGVIPILLKCVLSKSEAANAAGLFGNPKGLPEKEAVAEASKVIHDLSVAIQRLKSLHTRIPKANHFSLLIWAQSAQSVYEKYIKTWRLGFQDVVVSLANSASSEVGSTLSAGKTVSEGAWDQMPRNDDGYIVDAEGERVDVAFLLKRPLVRLKYLAKTIKAINIKKPSEQAAVLAKKFVVLMEKARQKVDEEKARLEDEAAAAIDVTRTRDPKSLAPLAGVKIDATRCVRARDYFDLHLPHSSGQSMECRVELLVRDDAPTRGKSGDVLICEVDESDRWLLFPPVEFKRISARAGDEAGELVVMVRGISSDGREWDEVFSLTTDDEEVRFEWVQWLGLSPVPRALGRKSSFRQGRPASSHASSSLLSASVRTESTGPIQQSRTPSPREVEIPIGERAGSGAKRWSKDVTSPRIAESDVSSILSSLGSERATLYGNKSDAGSYSEGSLYTESYVSTAFTPMPARERQTTSGERRATPRNLNEAMALAGEPVSGSPSLKRARAKRYHSSPTSKKAEPIDKQEAKPAAASTQLPEKKKSLKKERSIKKTNHAGGFSVWIPNSGTEDDSTSDASDEEESLASSYSGGKSLLHHRTSSVPTLQIPSMPKTRSSKREDEYLMSGALVTESLQTPSKKPVALKDPTSAPPKLERRAESSPVSIPEDSPPAPPPHRTPSQSQVKFAPTPTFTPTANIKRRSSSPLKHEYRPSSPSSESSYTEDEDSPSEYSEDPLTSDSEDDLDDHVASTYVSSVVAPAKEPEKPADLYSLPNGTIKPSESASQAPYRHVPQAVTVEAKPAKCVATIFTWSDKGHWELLHPQDCSIVITPGLIAAYQMSSTHDSDALPEERPFVAQELTPLVPLRRGTALDITIRSPPTPASRLRPGSNIMFRSRSSEDCEGLYNLINRSRINNPTYIALQNARPPTADGWAAAMERQNSQRDNGSGVGWLGMRRSKSYRASSRAHSTAGNTESSIGTISSVITAMKRFSGSGFAWDKSRSRMSFSRDGSDSLGSGGSGSHSPPRFVADQTLLSGGAGITNAKVRLYVLQSAKNWLDLGSGKLDILPKEEGAMIAAPIMLHTGLEKRIVVARKKRNDEGERLLDVTLPEPCFERWARTGIGVSVWVDAKGVGGGVADTGGVGEKRVVKYMIQMKSERECAYIYSLLGKLRY